MAFYPEDDLISLKPLVFGFWKQFCLVNQSDNFTHTMSMCYWVTMYAKVY